MKKVHVCKNPHKELNNQQKGALAETFIKSWYIKNGFSPEKLCEYDSDNNKQTLLIDNVVKIIRSSTIEKEKKIELMGYLKRNIKGLPDFIILTPDKKLMFVEAKYNRSLVGEYQLKRKKELESMGYQVSIGRLGKPTSASQTTLNDLNKPRKNKYAKLLNKVLDKLMFWKKPKLITTHKIG